MATCLLLPTLLLQQISLPVYHRHVRRNIEPKVRQDNLGSKLPFIAIKLGQYYCPATWWTELTVSEMWYHIGISVTSDIGKITRHKSKRGFLMEMPWSRQWNPGAVMLGIDSLFRPARAVILRLLCWHHIVPNACSKRTSWQFTFET